MTMSLIETFSHIKAGCRCREGAALPIAAAAAVGLALSGMLASADAPIDQTFGMYSYSQGCNTAIDPVSIVFTNGNGFHDHVFQHAKRSDHGGYEERSGGQYFWDNGGCTTSDDSAASNNGYLRDRYHFRYEVAPTTNGGQAYAATPHFDDFDANYGTHCVWYYGFIDGRSDVIYRWIIDGGEHNPPHWSYWGNDLAIAKCGGALAGNWDGYVAYINMVGNDAY
ncbi:MAG: hypothetical protein K6U88_02260 [Dehalococcoidia bacterium]|nr:hypothetical protein [Dehalococcoidia bacterium]